MKQHAPYGSWKSPITSDLIVAQTISLGFPLVDGDTIYWLESRPQEGGRNVVVRQTAGGEPEDVTPAGFNVRTRVHEYGGGAYWVAGGTVYFANFSDQRLYRQQPGAEPEPLTPAGVDMRFADGVLDPSRNRIICVREEHRPDQREAINTIVALPLDGGENAGTVLVEGHDFYAFPRLSPDGRQLAWLAWNHPNMPWDGTELWVAEVNEDGKLAAPRLVAGGQAESIFQPQWSPAGILTFISDRTGWWNPYQWRQEQVLPLHTREAEFGQPQWVFGISTYDFLPDDRLMTSYGEHGRQHMALLDPQSGQLDPQELPYTSLTSLRTGQDFVVFMGGSPLSPTTISRLNLRTGELAELRRSSNIVPEAAYLSEPRSITFPTGGGQSAYAYFYPPHNEDYAAPAGELPPLLVFSHGGPTGSASSVLNLSIQFWTSRSFAVVDVNYGGSTGYGREYRQRLNGQWGIVDVEDCVRAAQYLVEQGLVDGRRLAIRGGSAGGFTTLAALTFYDVFSAGASYFGVSDLAALAQETHKFESRYLDNLIGPYPQEEALYRARSPIHHVDKLSCPVIFFQGAEDKVVPPNQAEMMYTALRDKGVPTAYLLYEGEQHGFRRAENIKRSLDAELYFYSRIFNFPLADTIEPVDIANLD